MRTDILKNTRNGVFQCGYKNIQKKIDNTNVAPTKNKVGGYINYTFQTCAARLGRQLTMASATTFLSFVDVSPFIFWLTVVAL